MSIVRRRPFRSVVGMLLSPIILGCVLDERKPPPADGAGTEQPARRRVVFLGTSLTAAQQLDPQEGFPALIQARIDSAGLPFEVVDAGQSGESSAGARSRMRWLLEQPLEVLVVETGANDMLRAADVDSLRANLQAIVDTVRRVHPRAEIVLAGMLAAPNLGEAYTEPFNAVYPDVARRNGLPLIPFLLEGVAGDPEMNLPDGIHPNEQGHRRIAETVWRSLEPVLRRRAAAAGS